MNNRLAVEDQAEKLLMFDTATFWSDEYLIRHVRAVWEVEAVSIILECCVQMNPWGKLQGH